MKPTIETFPAQPSRRRALAAFGLAATLCVGGSRPVRTAPAQPGNAAARSAGKPGGGVFLRGINLAGSNRFIGARTWPTRPGLDYWLDMGMNCFRLMIQWENMQPRLEGELDERSVKGLLAVTEYLSARGAYSIVDIHNSMRFKTSGRDDDPGSIVGESAVTPAMFADLWTKLARVLKHDDRVILEPTNEPFGQNTDILVDTYNTAIAAIRAEGAKNLILIDGNSYSGAGSWVRSWDGTAPNAGAMLRIKDPADNVAFTPHEYMDRAGGTLPTCVVGAGPGGLVPVTEWAREHGQRLLLGEFGAGDNAVCREEIARMIAYVEANADVWFGWIYFAAYAGQRSYNVPDNYFLGIDPSDYGNPVDTPRGAVLRRFLRGAR